MDIGKIIIKPENVMIKNNPKLKDIEDPYDYYYENENFSVKSNDIKGIYMLDTIYPGINFTAEPWTEYDRLSRNSILYFITKNDDKIPISKTYFSGMIEKFGKTKGMYPIQKLITFQKRL